MANKDIVTKEILKTLAKDISKYILNIPICGEVELIDKEFTRVEKREADLLFKNANKIIHIEIQNNNHNKMHTRMLRYLSDLLFDYEESEILQFVIYIGNEKCNMKSSINRLDIDFRYNLIDIKDISCKNFLDSNEPAAIALAILCDFEGRDKQEVVNTIIKKLTETCKDEIEFRNHFKMLEILSSNRDLKDEVKKGVNYKET